MEKPNEKILSMDKIIALEESLQEQSKTNNEKYSDYLIGKFIDFVKNKEILDAYVRSVLEDLDDVAKYVLIEFSGLIVSYFELPLFERKETGNDKNNEMLEYIKNFSHQNHFLISEIKEALFFSDDSIKAKYEDWIKENDIMPEIKAEYKDVYDILSHYPSRQPYLREYIISLVFLPEIESKALLAFHFQLIIEFYVNIIFNRGPFNSSVLKAISYKPIITPSFPETPEARQSVLVYDLVVKHPVSGIPLLPVQDGCLYFE